MMMPEKRLIIVDTKEEDSFDMNHKKEFICWDGLPWSTKGPNCIIIKVQPIADKGNSVWTLCFPHMPHLFKLPESSSAGKPWFCLSANDWDLHQSIRNTQIIHQWELHYLDQSELISWKCHLYKTKNLSEDFLYERLLPLCFGGAYFQFLLKAASLKLANTVYMSKTSLFPNIIFGNFCWHYLQLEMPVFNVLIILFKLLFRCIFK